MATRVSEMARRWAREALNPLQRGNINTKYGVIHVYLREAPIRVTAKAYLWSESRGDLETTCLREDLLPRAMERIRLPLQDAYWLGKAAVKLEDHLSVLNPMDLDVLTDQGLEIGLEEAYSAMDWDDIRAWWKLAKPYLQGRRQRNELGMDLPAG